jgi:hypothetical protein
MERDVKSLGVLAEDKSDQPYCIVIIALLLFFKYFVVQSKIAPQSWSLDSCFSTIAKIDKKQESIDLVYWQMHY